MEVYHHQPVKHYSSYHAPSYPSYHQKTDYYQPMKHSYGHSYEKPMEYYKPMEYHKPVYKEPVYYPPPPPPKKKDDDHMDMKFNIEVPMKKIFDSVMKKDDEPKKPEYGHGGYGYEKPKEEKKEFEIKIPKIDIDGIIDKMHDKMGHEKEEEKEDEYKKK